MNFLFDEYLFHVFSYLWVFFVVILLSPDPSSCQVIFDGVGKGEIIVPGSGDIAILDQGIMEMTVEALLHIGHIFHWGDVANLDLLPTISITHRGTHDGYFLNLFTAQNMEIGSSVGKGGTCV